MKVGVCSWSLSPAGTDDLIDKVQSTQLSAIQLALDPIRSDWGAGAFDQIRQAGIEILSGMMMLEGEDYSSLETIRETGGVRPDAKWQINLEYARENARLAAAAGISLVTFHAGFIPHDHDDPERHKMLDRLATFSAIFNDAGCRVALETGQETASTLCSVLQELALPDVGVNFDPANMILYGMGDPVAALEQLAPHIFQLHIKDAFPSSNREEWGSEEPVGTGAVDWPAFFRVLQEQGIEGDLVIEREAGTQRVEDVIRAHQLVKTYCKEVL
ncbi:MAG: sugar phosphate isomerase/epimerase family protein [Planctomycetota bacterium]